MHDHCYNWVAQTLHTLPEAPRTVVELGSRIINGSVKPLFEAARADVRYVGVDLQPGPGVDVVADAVSWQPALPADCVVCTEVLEHLADAPGLVLNAWRMLAPGGHVLITCAMPPRTPHSAHDGNALQPGEFYRNVLPEALEGWLHEAGFVDLEVLPRPDRGDLYAVGRRPPA
jgi:SAM-dependent methyltransferase